MKHLLITLAIFAALCINADARNPRRALSRTAWVAPAVMNVRDTSAVSPDVNYILVLEFGPNGQVLAQYYETRSDFHIGAIPRGGMYPLKYKILQVNNDGSMDIKLKGKIHDVSSAVYNTKPKRWIYCAAGNVKGEDMDCVLGAFRRIN